MLFCDLYVAIFTTWARSSDPPFDSSALPAFIHSNSWTLLIVSCIYAFFFTTEPLQVSFKGEEGP